MDVLVLATSTYGDPYAVEWQPDLRHTVTYLRRAGLNVQWRYLPALGDPANLRSEPPLVLYVDVGEENRDAILPFLAAVRGRWPAVTVLAGGLVPTLDGQRVLDDCPAVDGCVLGERDHTLAAAVRAVRERQPLGAVAGLRTATATVPPGPLLDDLDLLGPMARDGLAELIAASPGSERVGYLTTSRGCPCRCTFCGVPQLYQAQPGRTWRGRSPAAVVSEMASLCADFGITTFVFQDDNFLGPGRVGRDRALGVAAELTRRRLAVRFSFCAPLPALRVDTLRALTAAGLVRVGVSIETTDPVSLRLLGKAHRADQIYPALRALEELGLACDVNLIVFGPLTTLDAVREDLRLLDYVRQSPVLGYSDAFPLIALRPFSWSRVRRDLEARGLLDEAGRCRFRDPRVARLVRFTAALEHAAGMTFKHRALLADPAAGQLGALLRIAPAIRAWIGLWLVPKYVGEACHVLERIGPGVGLERELAALVQSFEAELEPVRLLRQMANR